MNRTAGLETLYEEFGTLRESLPADAAREILGLATDQWRRSYLYTLLGYGVDSGGRFISEGASLSEVPPNVRQELRRLIDWCWYCSIHESVRLASRFAGSRPPEAFFELFPPDEISPEWATALSQPAQTDLVLLEGDVRLLLDRFGNLEGPDIWHLRNLHSFKDLRELQIRYAACKDDSEALTLRHGLAKQAAACLVHLGEQCGAHVAESVRGETAIQVLTHEKTGRLITHGLALLFLGTAHDAPAVLHSLLAGELVYWSVVSLAAQIYRVQEDMPTRVRVRDLEYKGPIKTLR